MKRRDAFCLLISLLLGPLGWFPPFQSVSRAAAPENAPPPLIVQRSPERGEEQGLDQPIVVVFDRAMDARSVEAAFAMEPAVPGDFAWPDARTLRFTPQAPLAREARYTVQIGPGAAAADGTALAEPYRFDFRTVGYLAVTQVIPAADSADVEVTAGLTVMFNRPVVPLTSLEQQAGLPQPLTFDPSIEGSGEWLNTSVYVFKPGKPLAGAMTYRVTVVAGLSDTTGGLLAEDHSWSFTTQLPQIVSISPEEDGTLVSARPDVQIVFSQDVDCGSARTLLTLHKQRSGQEVAGTSTCTGTTLSFRSDDRLEFNTRYEVRLGPGVMSLGGGAAMPEGRTWRFTTVPLPRILATTPRNGERNAEPQTSFSIKFNAPIDPATVMPNLHFTPPISPSRVYTYFSEWDQTFNVGFGAEPSSDYKVAIDPGIEDPYGNATGQRMVVQFRTRALDPAMQFLVPGQISTLGAKDPARFVVGYRNTPQVDFRLYRLDFAQMSDALDNWGDYQPHLSALVRKWTQPVEAPLNEFKAAPVTLAEDGGPLSEGIYLLTATAPGVDTNTWSHRHLLVVSPVNLTLKTTDARALVWATNAESGQPVSGLTLELLEQDGSAMARAVTTNDGLASFDLSARSVQRYGLYVGSREPIALVSGRWSEGISGGDFGYSQQYNPSSVRMHLYTERPIYRAGQTVYFRGIVRLENDVAFSLPSERTIQVRISDAAGEEVYNRPAQLDDFGAFDGELALGPGAALGYYSLSATYRQQSESAGFQVAAYRPPEFEVKVEPAAAEIAAGEPNSATVNVGYFFGGAVADVAVDWTVVARPYHHSSAQLGRYSFTDEDDPWACFDCWWRPPAPPVPILNGSGRADAQGRFVIDLPAAIAQFGANPDGKNPVGSRTLTVEATIQSRDGSQLSGRNTIVIHQGDFYIGLAPQNTVGKAGKEMAVDVLTVNWKDERLPNQPLKFQVYRREWVNTFVEDASGGGTWKWDTRDELVQQGALTTDSQGQGGVTFTPDKGGSYKIVVNGLDEVERRVQSSVFVWVSSPESVSWRRENNDRIDLIADKSTYDVGDTAEILIPSPFEGEQWALLTVERGEILSHEVIKLTSNSYVYRLPITDEHLPNVYVSAVLIKGKDDTNKATAYKVGYVALGVNPDPVRLKIEVTPSTASKASAAPGDTVTFDVRATGADGEPAQAALSIDLVDKAVLSLSPREPDAAFEAFYARRPLGVQTASGLSISLRQLVLEQIEAALKDQEHANRQMMAADGVALPAMAAPGAPAPTMMARLGAAKGEAAAAPPPGVALRSEFQDTAYWNARVDTDRSGHASVSIKLPDNLTTWVFRGVGVTAATWVGEATSDLLVTKPLLVRPVAPRFFVVDDVVQLAALVNNNTGIARDVAVALSSTGLKLSDPVEQTVRIEPGAEARVTWNVTVSDVESVDAVFSAVSGEFSDAAKPRLTTGPDGTLLVRRYTAPDIVGTGGQLTTADSRTEAIALPPRYIVQTSSLGDNRAGELDVRLDPSLAAGMQDGLNYLEHFPYECTEQTISRFLPNVLTYRALKQLSLANPELEAKLPGLLKQGMDKLKMQQHEDGGWGWWYDGQSNPYVSAYVVFALNKSLEAGFSIEGDVLARGLEYLQGQLVGADGINSYREANLQAYILYVLTDSKSTVGHFTAQVDDLYAHREKLSHYARAYLAMALGRANVEDTVQTPVLDKRLPTLLSDLQNAAILSATGAHWEENDYDWWAMNTDTRSTAVILDALVKLDPENALAPNVVRWLMIARKDGIWETTQETAWALISLTDWMVQTGELKGEYAYRVVLNGQELAAGGVDSAHIRDSVSLKVSIADLLADKDNRLTISREEGPGRLYYTAHLKVYLPVEDIQPANRGVAVFRRYVRPDCADGAVCPEVNEAQVGDTVQVRLTIVAPHDLYYVMVEDPLPAGAEAVDVNLATTSRGNPSMVAPSLGRVARPGATTGGRPYYSWWWNWYSRTEIRDDRVALFADYLPAGTYEYTYSFQTRLAGEYHVIPTVANEMYFPEVFGRSDGRLFTIREAGQ